MSTGENENDLRKMLDLTRIASVSILALHFYFQCYSAFKSWNATNDDHRQDSIKYCRYRLV